MFRPTLIPGGLLCLFLVFCSFQIQAQGQQGNPFTEIWEALGALQQKVDVIAVQTNANTADIDELESSVERLQTQVSTLHQQLQDLYQGSNIELCDGIDNNYDGRIDEGFNLFSDPRNCGECGNICSDDATCSLGTCQVPSPQACTEDEMILNRQHDPLCLFGFDSGAECDLSYLSESCSQAVSELSACAFGVIGSCGIGDDSYVCTFQLCRAGFNNVYGESATPYSPCEDGNACTFNDYYDFEGNCVAGSTITCNDGDACTVDSCNTSTGSCNFSVLPNCPVGDPEVCNTLDDDGDGQVDEDFDLSSDVSNCGFCGNVCDAGQSCELGICVSGV